MSQKLCALVINLLIYFLSIFRKRKKAADKKNIFVERIVQNSYNLKNKAFFAVDIDFKEAFGTIRKPLSLGV